MRSKLRKNLTTLSYISFLNHNLPSSPNHTTWTWKSKGRSHFLKSWSCWAWSMMPWRQKMNKSKAWERCRPSHKDNSIYKTIFQSQRGMSKPTFKRKWTTIWSKWAAHRNIARLASRNLEVTLYHKEDQPLTKISIAWVCFHQTRSWWEQAAPQGLRALVRRQRVSMLQSESRIVLTAEASAKYSQTSKELNNCKTSFQQAALSCSIPIRVYTNKDTATEAQAETNSSDHLRQMMARITSQSKWGPRRRTASTKPFCLTVTVT